MARHPDVVTGPDVAIVGWVPRIEPTVSSLPTGYQQCPWPWSLALLALFASGNPDPSIQSDTDFQNLLRSQEFRVAVALRNISAVWSGPSDEGSIHFDPPDVTIGYTPLNIWRPSGQGWQFIRTVRFSPGIGSAACAVTTNRDHCTMRLAVRFKIGWWLNVMQSMITKHRAPSAIVDLQYTIYRNGNRTIAFAGSLLPSQKYYVDWNEQNTHDMNFDTTREIRDFITAGNCSDAPAYVLHTCTV